MKPVALVAAAPLLGCIAVEGPCGVTIESGGGERRASVECDAGGTATILAPARTIEAVNEAAPRTAP